MTAPTTIAGLRTAVKTAAQTALGTTWTVREYTPDEESTFLGWVTIDGANYQDLAIGMGVVTGMLTLIDPARPISESEKARDLLIDPAGALITGLSNIDGLEIETASVSVESLDASVDETEPVGVVTIEFTALLAV